MRAVRLLAPGQIALCDVPRPRPAHGEVVLRVGGAGLCHTDLLVTQGAHPSEPFTLGHEVAGWVDEVGSGVDPTLKGTAAVVSCAWGCGRCYGCVRGEEPLCTTTRRTGVFGAGLYRDGGLADFMLVPDARYLVPLDHIPPREAASLADAASTPYHAIRRSLPNLVPGTTAVVIGIGGLGHAAVQLLRATSSTRVVAVDIDARRLEAATQLGASEAVDGGKSEADEDLRCAVGSWGAALVLDFVGTRETLRSATSIVAPGGRIVVIGAGGGAMKFSFAALPYDASIGTAVCGGIAELREVVSLAEAGEISIDSTYIRLEDVVQSYRALDAGTLTAARAVAIPHDGPGSP